MAEQKHNVDDVEVSMTPTTLTGQVNTNAHVMYVSFIQRYRHSNVLWQNLVAEFLEALIVGFIVQFFLIIGEIIKESAMQDVGTEIVNGVVRTNQVGFLAHPFIVQAIISFVLTYNYVMILGFLPIVSIVYELQIWYLQNKESALYPILRSVIRSVSCFGGQLLGALVLIQFTSEESNISANAEDGRTEWLHFSYAAFSTILVVWAVFIDTIGDRKHKYDFVTNYAVFASILLGNFLGIDTNVFWTSSLISSIFDQNFILTGFTFGGIAVGTILGILIYMVYGRQAVHVHKKNE